MTANCRECGHPAEAGQRFCRACGREFDPADAGAGAHPSPGFAAPPAPAARRTFRVTLLDLMIVVAIVGFIAAVSIPTFPRIGAGGSAKRKACVSNMKTIEGAVYLFLMEHPAGSPFLRALRDGGYLKSDPVCPSNGQYSVKVGAGSSTPKVGVACSTHGPVDDPVEGP